MDEVDPAEGLAPFEVLNSLIVPQPRSNDLRSEAPNSAVHIRSCIELRQWTNCLLKLS